MKWHKIIAFVWNETKGLKELWMSVSRLRSNTSISSKKRRESGFFSWASAFSSMNSSIENFWVYSRSYNLGVQWCSSWRHANHTISKETGGGYRAMASGQDVNCHLLCSQHERNQRTVCFNHRRKNKTLFSFLFSSTGNGSGDTGTSSMSEVLKSNTTLTALDLSREDKRKKTHKWHPSMNHCFVSRSLWSVIIAERICMQCKWIIMDHDLIFHILLVPFWVFHINNSNDLEYGINSFDQEWVSEWVFRMTQEWQSCVVVVECLFLL